MTLNSKSNFIWRSPTTPTLFDIIPSSSLFLALPVSNKAFTLFDVNPPCVAGFPTGALFDINPPCVAGFPTGGLANLASYSL